MRCNNSVSSSVVLLGICALLLQGTNAAVTARKMSTAVVIAFAQDADNPNGSQNEYLALRVMLYWLLRDPWRCVCTDVVVVTSAAMPIERRTQLKQDGARLLTVKDPNIKLGSETWRLTWIKLMVFNLTEYDRVIQLDTDMVLLDRVDQLFAWAESHLDSSCAVGAVPDLEHLPYVKENNPVFNSGLLWLRPNATDFELLVRIAQTTENIPSDQDVMHAHFSQPPNLRWCRIPRKFHRFPSYRWPERNVSVDPGDVVAHGAAWKGNLHPKMHKVWELGRVAVESMDWLRENQPPIGGPLQQKACGHCRLGIRRQQRIKAPM